MPSLLGMFAFEFKSFDGAEALAFLFSYTVEL